MFYVCLTFFTYEIKFWYLVVFYKFKNKSTLSYQTTLMFIIPLIVLLN